MLLIDIKRTATASSSSLILIHTVLRFNLTGHAMKRCIVPLTISTAFKPHLWNKNVRRYGCKMNTMSSSTHSCDIIFVLINTYLPIPAHEFINNWVSHCIRGNVSAPFYYSIWTRCIQSESSPISKLFFKQRHKNLAEK